MANSTSPHLFKEANEQDILFIDKELERNIHAMFIRKIAPEFPDEILRHYIYEHDKEKDDQLVLIEPVEMIYNSLIDKTFYIVLMVVIIGVLYQFTV